MNALDLVNESLGLLEDETGEFNDMLYSKFYDSSPDAEALMSHMDELMKGKMLEEVIRLQQLINLAMAIRCHTFPPEVVHYLSIWKEKPYPE